MLKFLTSERKTEIRYNNSPLRYAFFATWNKALNPAVENPSIKKEGRKGGRKETPNICRTRKQCLQITARKTTMTCLLVIADSIDAEPIHC